MRHTIAVLSALAALLLAPPIHACSFVVGYVHPSSFELVLLAESITVAHPERAPRVEPRNEDGEYVTYPLTFRAESAIKGEMPAEEIAFPLAGLGPSSLGMCTRSGFERGKRYLLFLRRNPQGLWERLDYPGTPDAADYDGDSGEWTRTVRRYLAVQQQAPATQLATLRRMVETGQGLDGERLSVAERFDLVDHLSAVTRWKPTGWLLDRFLRLERGEAVHVRPDSVWDQADEEEAVAAFLAPSVIPVLGVEQLRREVLRALALGDHQEALPLFERLFEAPVLPAGERGLVLLYLARHGQYPRAFRWIEEHLLDELARLDHDKADDLLTQIDSVQHGDSYQESPERWRTDPHAAAAWPALKARIERYLEERAGKPSSSPVAD